MEGRCNVIEVGKPNGSQVGICPQNPEEEHVRWAGKDFSRMWCGRLNDFTEND